MCLMATTNAYFVEPANLLVKRFTQTVMNDDHDDKCGDNYKD